MTDELTVECVFKCDCPLVDIIFVHGLAGDPKTTWCTEADGTFWPKWLQEDFNKIAVHTLGYPASLVEKWSNKEMDMFERAVSILEKFAGLGIGKRPIVFVTHSLGGVLVKMILKKSSESKDADWQLVTNATKLVIFISTPHSGETIATVAKHIPGMSRHVKLLANKFGFLEDLNRHYRNLSSQQEDMTTVVYYEKHTTKGAVVVSRESADPGINNVEPVAIDKNHINICKPPDKNDTVYLGIKRHIQNALTFVEGTTTGNGELFWTENYSEKNIEDRRDLLQKLIDAGREHEYNYANAAQNRFARQYTKTGLLTAARTDHEYLLSEIETRFITHVYHPLICKSARDSEIRVALQEEVIDPLVGRNIGGTRFSARSVLSGLYFLTEQCHIRWDTG